MKLLELLKNQEINVQLMWEKEKIEFSAMVVDTDEKAVYITPYIHNGSELKLNVTNDTGVVCNLYANDTVTNERVSWKGIELTTVNKNDSIVYCIKAHGFNNVSNNEDRREHERVIVQVDASVLNDEGTEQVIIHDISDNGLGIYATDHFVPTSRHLTIYFTDNIDERLFNFKLECDIARIVNQNGNLIIGCRLLGENRDYQIYEFMKRLKTRYSHLVKEDNKDTEEDNSVKENNVDESADIKESGDVEESRDVKDSNEIKESACA